MEITIAGEARRGRMRPDPLLGKVCLFSLVVFACFMLLDYLEGCVFGQ